MRSYNPLGLVQCQRPDGFFYILFGFLLTVSGCAGGIEDSRSPRVSANISAGVDFQVVSPTDLVLGPRQPLVIRFSDMLDGPSIHKTSVDTWIIGGTRIPNAWEVSGVPVSYNGRTVTQMTLIPAVKLPPNQDLLLIFGDRAQSYPNGDPLAPSLVGMRSESQAPLVRKYLQIKTTSNSDSTASSLDHLEIVSNVPGFKVNGYGGSSYNPTFKDLAAGFFATPRRPKIIIRLNQAFINPISDGLDARGLDVPPTNIDQIAGVGIVLVNSLAGLAEVANIIRNINPNNWSQNFTSLQSSSIYGRIPATFRTYDARRTIEITPTADIPEDDPDFPAKIVFVVLMGLEPKDSYTPVVNTNDTNFINRWKNRFMATMFISSREIKLQTGFDQSLQQIITSGLGTIGGAHP